MLSLVVRSSIHRPFLRCLLQASQRCFAKASASPSDPTLNCGLALIKAHEKDSFQTILGLDVSALQGIGPKHQEHFHKLRLKTVADLASNKFYHLAKAICVLAQTAEDPAQGRLPATLMNINKGVDKEYENLTLREMAKAPVWALQGISKEAGETFAHVGIKTVDDLAHSKYFTWAEAMLTASKYEQVEK